MKKLLFIFMVTPILVLTNCKAGSSKNPGSNPDSTSITANSSVAKGQIIHLSNEAFKKKVFNYEVNKTWKYEGTQPAIIDFYADWCGPCRKMSPIIEEIAKEYAGKIVVYKVDTDAEAILSQNMGISSLPTLIFIPAEGQPQASMGLITKEMLVKAINDILLNKK